MAKANALPKMGKLSLGDIALGALIAELVGTFILTFAVLNTLGNAIVAAVTMVVLVLMLSKLSGGHVNPLITVGLLATKQISLVKAIGYIIAQFLGAMLAVVIATQFLGNTPDPYTGQAAELFKITATGDWKPFFGEMIGAMIFCFGVASAFLGKKEGFDSAFTIGGALLLGLIVAASGSNSILNPAVALGVGVLDISNHWSICGYIVAPIIGSILGMFLYKILQSDISLSFKKKS